jgi:hypothetical protein
MKLTGFQKIVENFVLTCLTILKILVFSDVLIFFKHKKLKIKPGKESIILGNGPSLIESIEKNPSFITDKDLVCVNLFPETPYYKQLKPKYFITGGPELWMKNVSEEWEVRRKHLFNTIKDQTDWDIIFLIPTLARKHKHWREILSLNTHIKITYYNITPIEGFKLFIHFCFKFKLGTPRAHNVLNPAIMQMMSFGYRKIYLLGADHSWLKEIIVDDDNRVLLRQKHFYDHESAKHTQMGNIDMGVRKLHEMLHKFYLTFSGYFIIKDYASTVGTKIINVTPNSFIDAFERKDIEKI